MPKMTREQREAFAYANDMLFNAFLINQFRIDLEDGKAPGEEMLYRFVTDEYIKDSIILLGKIINRICEMSEKSE